MTEPRGLPCPRTPEDIFEKEKRHVCATDQKRLDEALSI